MFTFSIISLVLLRVIRIPFLVRLLNKTTFTAKMVYAYIRVSTDKQTVENQRFEVQKFATEKMDL